MGENTVMIMVKAIHSGWYEIQSYPDETIRIDFYHNPISSFGSRLDKESATQLRDFLNQVLES